MENNEILKGNKLIAEFMGANNVNTINQYVLRYPKLFPNGAGICWEEDFKYHSSWDWLIPVYKKFDKIKVFNHTEKYHEYVEMCNNNDTIISLYCIESAFIQIVRAIEWYNQQSINQNTEQK